MRVPTRVIVKYDKFAWPPDAWIGPGWYLATVLSCKAKLSKKGNPMLVVGLGLAAPGGQIGARTQTWIPQNYRPKVAEFLAALAPDCGSYDEAEERPNAIWGRQCAAEIYEDKEWQRDDGRPSWKVKALKHMDDALAEFGSGWELRPYSDDPSEIAEPEWLPF